MRNEQTAGGEKLKQLIINREKLETRVALLNSGKLEEYQIERPDHGITSGSIYLGKIVRHDATLQAAFVDIGAEKNGFLHYWDMMPATYDMVDQLEKRKDQPIKKGARKIADKIRSILWKKGPSSNIIEAERNRRQKKITVKDIPQIFPAGSEILVQIVKGPIGVKGARLTTNITIPGRYLVLLPYSDHIGLSSKIEDSKERKRLREILSEFDIPDGMGMICRTVGEGRKRIFFQRDLDMLTELWRNMEDALKNPSSIKGPVYREPSLLECTVRDFLTEDIDEIVVDDEESFKFLRELVLKFVDKKTADRVLHFVEPEPIFDYFAITSQLNDILRREVQLPSGGYICIDETEALISIDVNSGKNRGAKDQSAMFLRTNMEAAAEVARQLRLRNVGGLVVIDFIDMRSEKDRDAVFKHMKKLVADDSAKSKILPISKLGLMEMTRQRERESLKARIFDYCPYCAGSGRVKSAMSMSVEIQRKIHEIFRTRKEKSDIALRVIVNPAILARLKNEDADMISDMEKKFGKTLSFRADPAMHVESFKIVDPDTGAEY